MRLRPTLAIRKVHVAVGHAQKSATQLLVKFVLRLPSKVIGSADQIGMVCHDYPQSRFHSGITIVIIPITASRSSPARAIESDCGADERRIRGPSVIRQDSYGLVLKLK